MGQRALRSIWIRQDDAEAEATRIRWYSQPLVAGFLALTAIVGVGSALWATLRDDGQQDTVVENSASAVDWGATGADRPITDYSRFIAGASRPVFNSFRDVPNVGSEENFLTAKISGAPGGFSDPAPVFVGDILLVRVYVHNNADGSLNGDRFDGPGVATGTRVGVLLPNSSGTEIEVLGRIAADNASPEQIVDSVKIRSQEGRSIRLRYVPGSARLTNNAFSEEAVEVRLSDDLVSDRGQLIGWDRLDGVLPGCFKFIALVTFEVEVLVGQS